MRPGDEVLIVEPGERRRAVLETIREARRSLLLSVFRCEDFEVLDEIAAAVRRGVRVTALFTPSAKNWDSRLKDLGRLLDSMGAEVRRYAGDQEKYHGKYLVVDKRLALVASLNFTRKCFERTCDFILLTKDEGVVAGLVELFKSDSRRPPRPLARGLSGRLLVGPETARKRFRDLLAGARRSIQIIDHRVRDSEVVQLLQDREQAGVQVQILGQGDLAGFTSHGKLLIVDGQAAVIGSASLARPSLDWRRELSILIEQRDLVEQLGDLFRRLASRTPGGVGPAPASSSDDDEDLNNGN